MSPSLTLRVTIKPTAKIMNQTFGGEVFQILQTRHPGLVLDSLFNIPKLKAADQVTTLALLFGANASLTSDYQAMSPEEVANLVFATAKNIANQQVVASRGSFLESLAGLLNGLG